jgi:fumarate hydratase subunit alpha
MRTIEASEITKAVKQLAIEAAYYLNQEMIGAFQRCLQTEKSPIGKAVFEELIENAELSKSELIPYCQDTGFAVVFLEIGQDVHIVDGLVTDAAEEGVRQAYREGYLRMSICDPFTRKNTGDNTPAIVHISIVEGDRVKIIFDAKGGGSENMSRVTMLAPSAGIEGIKKFVIQRCLEAGSNPCPPIVVGVGIGGTFEVAALLAKKALMLPLEYENPDPQLAQLEEELLEEINKTGHGPQGLGGTNYALSVKVLKHPCHIASLPVAVNIDCHAHRHKEVIL